MNSEGRVCRLCGADLPTTALVTLPSAPRGAQAFLADEAAASDAPISLEVRGCTACGLVQACCDPVSNWQHVIRSSGYSPAMRDVRRRQFEALLGREQSAGPRVLEAGSGPGDNLAILAESGARAFGVEASPAAAHACSERGLSVEMAFPTRGRALSGNPSGLVTRAATVPSTRS